MIFAFTFGVVVAAFGIVAWRWSRLVRQVGRLAARIEGLGTGGTRLPPAADPALGRIAEAVNALIRRLDAQVAALSSGRAELVAIMENMGEGVLVLDRTGHIVLANRSFARLLGLAEPPARGADVHEVARIPRLLELIRGAATAPGSGEVEIAGPFPAEPGRGATARTLMVRAAPMEGAPEPGAVLAVLDDVTDFKRLDEIRRDFVANASHELKTPLAAIQGYAEMLAEESGHADATVILNNARRMSKLVDDLLALSRLEAHSMDLKFRPVALAPFIARALQLVRPQADAKHLSLAQALDAAVEDVPADEEALLQILVNLLDNAVKYTPAGGRVAVLTRALPDGRVTLAVEDTGPGIPPEHLPRVFERFYRVDRARSRELGGTGLGLAIVKHLAELHGGVAYLTSRPGQGTEAGVTLPRDARTP